MLQFFQFIFWGFGLLILGAVFWETVLFSFSLTEWLLIGILIINILILYELATRRP